MSPAMTSYSWRKHEERVR